MVECATELILLLEPVLPVQWHNNYEDIIQTSINGLFSLSVAASANCDDQTLRIGGRR